MDSAFWGLIGAIIGAGASVVTTIVTNKNARLIHKQGVDFDRQEAHKEFQRNTYLKLQEVLLDGMRLVRLAHISDLKNYHKTSTWGASLLGEELDENLRIFFRESSILRERLTDSKAREIINNLTSDMRSPLLAKSLLEAEEKLKILGTTFDESIASLGANLREYLK
jgi:hypothetical protein